MNPESVMAADDTDSALANGCLTMGENVCVKENGAVSDETLDTTSESQNESPGNISTLDAIEQGIEVEIVVDSKCVKGEKAQRKLKHEKLPGGKNILSVEMEVSNGTTPPLSRSLKVCIVIGVLSGTSILLLDLLGNPVYGHPGIRAVYTLLWFLMWASTIAALIINK